jgi:hypothetical protein
MVDGDDPLQCVVCEILESYDFKMLFGICVPVSGEDLLHRLIRRYLIPLSAVCRMEERERMMKVQPSSHVGASYV